MKTFREIFFEADAAGKAAVSTATINPMVVRNPQTKEEWFESDGPCGFAWIHFAGNTAFGRWAKQQGFARPDYPKGLSYWVHDYNQSIQKKETYANAFANVLQSYGIKAYANSRMD